jgi:hypothetical protein
MQEGIKEEKLGIHVGGIFSFIRHGQRLPTGEHTHGGRKTNAQIAMELVARKGSAYAIKPDEIHVIGSNAGPKNRWKGRMEGKSRSHETPEQFAIRLARHHNINDRKIVSLESPILSYNSLDYYHQKYGERLKRDDPYGHIENYDRAFCRAVENAILKKFDRVERIDPLNAAQIAYALKNFSTEEQQHFGDIAQDAALNAAFSLHSDEMEDYATEVAGAFCIAILQFIDALKKRKQNTVLTVPAGTHGGTMEFLLQKALVWETKKEVVEYEDKPWTTVEHRGFKNITEIGGAFHTSEGYNLEVELDGQGHPTIGVTFFNKQRRKGIFNARLDLDVIRAIADRYSGMRKEIGKPIPASGLETL